MMSSDSPTQPLIHERYLDVPSQRLYYLSLGLLCQAIKLFDFICAIASAEHRAITCRKWLLVDLLYCITLSRLRIPRLRYRKSTIVLHILLLWFLDGFLFGAFTMNGFPLAVQSRKESFYGYLRKQDIPSTPEPFSIMSFFAPLSFGIFSAFFGSKNAHLEGQHTVRMSPISTARINPNSATFCLSSSDDFVLVPVLMNNTELSGITFTITPLGSGDGLSHEKIETFELTHKELKAIEQVFRDSQQVVRTPVQHKEEYDEYDDDEEDASEEQRMKSELLQSQSLAYIKVSKPGILRLQRVIDKRNIDAYLARAETVVVPCPQMRFVDDSSSINNIRCASPDADTRIMIDVYGVPPLSLRWMKAVNGQREQFLVEGIEGDHCHGSSPYVDDASYLVREYGSLITPPVPQDLKIPLTISLAKPGTYLYALEEIRDGVGNVVHIDNEIGTPVMAYSQTKTTRSFVVLRKPTASFERCNSATPVSLLIGSEAALPLQVSGSDDFDAPWEVYTQYQPSFDTEGGHNTKRLKPWKKTFKVNSHQKRVVMNATTPGEYAVVGLEGKHCTGEILLPDICRVVERPLPQLEIEWRKIHECSGDTGVSASLILRGTPPFHVHYLTQRDNEAPQRDSKSYTSSRGDLTIQPDKSGHYTFTVTHISDANYKKVDVHGPTIEQSIHPPASVVFSDFQGGKKDKRMLHSCSGDTVDVDVELKGKGPWNVEVQTIDPRSLNTLRFEGIESADKTLTIPIPETLKKGGGSFEIALISIEDAYKCKRPVTVPSIKVNVKRVKPTAQFYGSEQERHITIPANEEAHLPLRLTGDGPWRLSYRLGARTTTVVLSSPNEPLLVMGRGTYQILEISDNQCPGIVIADASTFVVDWIPRPTAQLAPETKGYLERLNGSFILPPVCEATAEHVDLDLSGRPPFQIVYNVAQNSDTGGTRLIDQPTFSSIQPRTRFQLQTTNAGRIYYEVKQVGDAAYPLAKYKNMVIPISERLLFEQQVNVRPTARFKNRNRMTFCLYQSFIVGDSAMSEGVLILDGTPPFSLKLSIRSLSENLIDTRTVEIVDHTWNINLPSYSFTSVGPHLIKIESVVDASQCAHSLDPVFTSTWVDVAESAAIIPIERRGDICVGEVTQFQLEGIPPWTIGYSINGKHYVQEANVSPFSLLQLQPGEFAITSIAHQQSKCNVAVTDLMFTVHDLPSAQVGHGKRVYEDIHEGEQAAIVFTFVGEPPFTVTYQRSEPVSKKGGKTGKVLETHTVSRTMSKEYVVFSALEGTWTVTSISDRYCRYPPAQPDIVGEKH